MKKFDLTRRANRVAEGYRYTVHDPVDVAAHAFESGYRAARADLRRELSVQRVDLKNIPGVFLSQLIRKWLRPIR